MAFLGVANFAQHVAANGIGEKPALGRLPDGEGPWRNHQHKDYNSENRAHACDPASAMFAQGEADAGKA